MNSPALSITGRLWELAEPSPDAAITRSSLHPLAARCLSTRVHDIGLEEDTLSEWLQPSIAHLHDPSLMMGMDRAIARIRQAVDRREHVRIVTDYDVDGTTSSLILQQTLMRVGGSAVRGMLDYHIPDRFNEGYGFSVDAARRAAKEDVSVIITADIGVKDHEAVEEAARAGVDVIVCDHHLPDGASVPERAYAVLCPPQRGCPYPNKALAACGVSLKVAQALLSDHPKSELLIRSMMKVAAIGTVADVVDLSGLENRAIVSLGVEQLRRGRNAPGLQALIDIAGLSPETIDAGALGYKIGPRINAAGRLRGADAVVELFSERDPRRAHARARELDRLNEQRKEIQGSLVDTCLAQLGVVPGEPLPDGLPGFAVLWGQEDEGWHRGVVGIVAARVRDAINRPVAIIAVSGDAARGSVRSTPAVHAVDALSSARELLQRFGGHPAAAGFSVDTDKLPALRAQLDRFAREQLAGTNPAPSLRLDTDCRPMDVTWESVRALQRLEPHGKGNPAPLLWVRGVRPTQLRLLSGGKHLKFRVGDIDAVWWGGGRFIEHLHHPVDLAARPGINHWRGRSTLQFTVEDVRFSSR